MTENDKSKNTFTNIVLKMRGEIRQILTKSPFGAVLGAFRYAKANRRENSSKTHFSGGLSVLLVKVARVGL